MLVVLICNTLNKLTTARNQSSNFYFPLSHNVSLLISYLNFKKSKDMSQIFGARQQVPLPKCTRHAWTFKALLISLMPTLGEQILSLDSKDVQCHKLCWFDGRTLILFLFVNFPTLKVMEEKTSRDTKTAVQPECSHRWDVMEKPRPENLVLH